jgi:ATP-dependent DNA helicase RecG
LEKEAIDDRVLEVVRLAVTPKPSAQLLEELGLIVHTKNYKKYILPALERGWIEMTVPDKPRSRNQKYRVTELGRAVLDD